MQAFTIREKLSLAAIAGAALLLVGVLGHFPPRPDNTLHRALGQSLAKEALNLAGANGSILVITRDTEAFPQPAADILLAAFQKEVVRASGKPASVRRLQVDPLRPAEVPAGDLFELLRKGQVGQVLVSLLGPPLLSEEQWARVRPIKPKLVAFCPGPWADTVDLGRLLESGYLHAAVVSRPVKPTGATSRRPSRFDELYWEVTVSDAAKLHSL